MEASLERQLRSGGTSKYVGNFESLAGFPSLQFHIVYSTSSSRPTSYLAYSLTRSITQQYISHSAKGPGGVPKPFFSFQVATVA